MKDPVRLRDLSGSADDLVREVLRGDEGMAPTEREAALVWGKLAGQLGLSSALLGVATADALHQVAGAASGAKSVGTTASMLAFLKGVMVGMVACGALWGGARLIEEPAGPGTASAAATGAGISGRSPRAPQPLVVAAPHEAAPNAAVGAAPPPPPGIREAGPPSNSANTVSLPSVASPGDPASASTAQFGEAEPGSSELVRRRESELKQEALLLRRARQQLRAGQLASANQSLEESRRLFPTPQLRQEYEALVIELLFRDGHQAAAAARAEAFLKMFPGSPHANRVKTFTSSSPAR
jgi:hypothetical protein